jgi:predicted permease
MSSFVRDVRYAIRSLRNAPLLSFVAILALSVGIGVTTTVFSMIYAALLRGLPYPGGDRIVQVDRDNPALGAQGNGVWSEDFLEYRAQQHSLEHLSAITSGTVNVSGTEKAERFTGSWVTADLFAATGVKPILGRGFRAGEDAPGGDRVAVIGYRMWKDRYAGDPATVGRIIRVNGQPYTVVGVMPEGYDFPTDNAIWLPAQIPAPGDVRGQGTQYDVIGGLAPGVSLDRANAEFATISKRLATQYPTVDGGWTTTVRSFLDANIGRQAKGLLFVMLGAVFFVLLIACANVANLLIDRAAHRSKEMGIRTALGASRGAVIRQNLVESLVLSAIAMVFGVLLAYWGVALFRGAVVDTDIPSYIQIKLFPPVLLFSAGVALLSTLLAGGLPAIQSARADINSILKDASRGASTFRVGRASRMLVIFEIALSCGLLVSAGLMIKSVAQVRHMDPGFQTNGVFTARVGFPADYPDTLAQHQFFTQLAQRLQTLPGVRAAALASGLPATQQGFSGGRVALEGHTYTKDADYPNTLWLSATPGYFKTLSMPLVAGRTFTDADDSTSVQVAVVSESFARKIFPGVNAVGRRVKLGSITSKQPWLTIVGVVGDVFSGDNENPNQPELYRPYAQAPQPFNWIALRTDGPPSSLTQPVRALVSQLNPDIPLYWVSTLQYQVAKQLWFVRVFGTMFMIFGFIALFLAVIGLYAVMSFSVSRRAREVGIRMALGATSRGVVRLILRQGLVQLVIGTTVGLAFAAWISRLMSFILFQVDPRDPMIFGGVAVALGLSGLLACLGPASRATRIDPLVALRAD